MQPLLAEDADRVGGYRLLGRLGAGGMGVVYLGRAPSGRRVAVKVVHQRFARDPHYRARFRREVAAARTVTGVFTAPLLDADPEADAPWLATAYLPGLSLREAIGAFGALPAATVRLLAAALAEALADIHRAGLVHRDLKPGNIMLTAGGPRVIDFGIVSSGEAAGITRVGSLVGTPGFMSPEQASGGTAGPAGDVFSLGAVLAFAATGKEPFDADDRATVLERVRLARVDLRGLTDRRLRAFLATCLRREPGHRPTAAELLDRLGEPSASVHGTRWLPAPLAEEIDRRAALPPHATVPVTSGIRQGAAPDQTTADPAAETSDAPAVPVLPGPRDPVPRGPARRRLLMAVAAVPVAAGAAVALGESILSSADGSPASRPSRSSSPPPSADTPPPKAVERWRTKVFDNEKGSVDVRSAAGVVLATHTIDRDVRALDPRTGEILWTHPTEAGPSDTVTSGPDTAYLVSPRKGDVTSIRAVRPVSGGTRWTYRLQFGEFPWAVAAVGSLALVAAGNQVHALNVEDGRPRWTADVTAMTLRADARLVTAVGDSSLVGLDTSSGRTRWTFGKKLVSIQDLLTGDGLVFARDTYGMLYAISGDDGRTVWKKRLDYRSSVRRTGKGLVYVDEADGRLRALRAATGEPVWSRGSGRNAGNPYATLRTLGLRGGTLYASADDGTLSALDAADGRVLWTCAAAATGSDAVTTAGLVCVGAQDGHVAAFSPPGRSNGGARGAT